MILEVVPAGGCSGDRTRVVSCGGQNPGVETTSFIEIATTGDAQDFGDMQNSYRGWGSKMFLIRLVEHV